MYIYIYIYIYKVSLLENIIYTIYITSRLLVIGFSNSRISRDLDFLTRILGSRTILICIGQINYLTENQTLYIDWPSLSICSVRKEQSPRRHCIVRSCESQAGRRAVSDGSASIEVLCELWPLAGGLRSLQSYEPRLESKRARFARGRRVTYGCEGASRASRAPPTRDEARGTRGVEREPRPFHLSPADVASPLLSVIVPTAAESRELRAL